MTTEFTAAALVEAFATEGIASTVEDTGGGTATLIIDGGIVQVGPGAFGANGATFDTEELSYGFYSIDENGDAWEESDAVWIERGTSPADIARQVTAAYRTHKD